MKTKYLLPILLLASPAYAGDVTTQQQNGSGNTQIIGNGNNSPVIGSNNPHVKAYGGSSKADADAAAISAASSHSSSKSSADQSQGQHQVAKGGSADNKGNSLSVNQDYDQPVSSAVAAPLVAAEDTCMGSSSVGGQGTGFGLSFGSTWQDKDCVRRKDARELWNMGRKKAALALMCQNASVAEAMEAADDACPAKFVEHADLAPASGGIEAANGGARAYPDASSRLVGQ